MAEGLLTDSVGQGGSLREDVTDRYHKTKPGELERGFFRRESTRKYIEEIAALDDVTIYAGAGVSADVGAPLSDELMPYILGQWMKALPDLKGLSDDAKAEIEHRVTRAIEKTYPPAYIGSIAREIARLALPPEKPEKTRKFVTEIEEANQGGYTSGGFLARSVGALAFALKAKGKSVGIITTNYDRTIFNERRKLLEYFAEFADDCDYLFEERTSASNGDPVDPDRIPVFQINGAVSDDSDEPLVIGEVDFFSWYDQHLNEHQLENQRWRSDRLDDALDKGACIFVGSSLTDPDVLAKLAATKFQQPRYAVLLAPDQKNEPDGSALLDLDEEDTRHVDAVERAFARHVVAKRFLHLGVIPIMVDFPHQVPQLLTELALRVQQDGNYKPYSDRSMGWWSRWAKLFGFEDEEKLGRRNLFLQAHWAHELAAIRDEVRELLDPAADDEKIMVEVWVRNPKNRTLFLWATSEGIWLNGDTASGCDLSGSEIVFDAQRAFRKGRTHAAEIKPKQALWKYAVSVPLTLHADPWYHLPIGVVSVRSSEVRGELWGAADRFEDLEKLERLLVGPMNGLFDPDKLDPDDRRWDPSGSGA